ncbi:hypothetical protein [Arthrobacter sp. A2-55]|uniref:hypothetical protein n=1 Tax=Arthrobacter sp. A2-55 TaxID=2897337 RepID=UPI0021CD647E|nr:hypothetical protein [Arthrobacter sp. A2-55]MCU6481933.1 hypothetical protein [Arthrobacter sp. A2-55]
MPTLEQLAIKHRLAEMSVAQLITVPDTLGDSERDTFLELQDQYVELTARGLRDNWLRRAVWGKQTVYPRTDRQHPTRRVSVDEPADDYDTRMKYLNQRLASDVQRTVDKIRDAQKLLHTWAEVTVAVDWGSVRTRARAESEERWNAPAHRERRTVEIRDLYADEEWEPISQEIGAWRELQARGLSEGWLITKAHVVIPHPLDAHPSRTVQVLESEEVVAARVAGLSHYIATRVSA